MCAGYLDKTKYCRGSINENSSYVRVSRQISSNGCVLPQHPTHGQWTIYQSPSQLSSGQLAPSGSILQVNCTENYKLDEQGAPACVNGNWTTKIGECLKTCPSIQNTAVMKVTCTYNNRKLESCSDVFDGTIARFQCANFYEDQELERQPVQICFNGRWSQRLPVCVPVCGQKTVKRDPRLIVGGSIVTKGDYPWQVALYTVKDKMLICGGSLLNQRVVLTAAHCITGEDGKLLPKKLFRVAVGKYFRQYDDPRDFNGTQFSSIHKMFIPRQYKGDIQNYFGDIAILVTKKTFFLSVRVQPVCVDWGSNFYRTLLDPTRAISSSVSGWGFTVQHKDPSDVLKEVNVTLVTEEQCNQNLTDDYTRFITDDKLCAGYLDSGNSVCKGDSGGGLVAKYKNKYYIIAVVSISPQAITAEGGCDSRQYALYTKVSHYIETFILEKEARFRPKYSSIFENGKCGDDLNCKADVETLTTSTTTTHNPVTAIPKGNCILPQYPHFGRWSIFAASSLFSPGMSVASGTTLQISCVKDYKLNGNSSLLCENGRWSSDIGQCSSNVVPLVTSIAPITSIIETDEESSECKEDKFRCSSGQCIDQNLKCDGIADCDDHSDEIRATCWNVCCPVFTLKCQYGACVNGRALCNGIVECFDGSDEDPTICETPAIPDTGASGSCVLPNHPSFGGWLVLGFPPGTHQPRTPVGAGTILKVECNKHYILDGNNALFCENGQWSSKIGQCSKVCPPMMSTSTMRVTCIYKNKETENCTNAIDGTLAKFECAPFYEDLGLKTHPIHICQDGTWDQRKVQCVPACGQKTDEPTLLIINGTNVNKVDYPWQVAIYAVSDKTLICSGTLLSQKIILTAAHCITDGEGNLLSKEKFIVAVVVVYNDSRDYNETQFSELHAMYVPNEYRENKQNYVGGIGVLITRKVFTLSRRVQPVCVDSGQTYVNNKHGYVTGWGFTTENSKQADVLKELKVSSVSFAECKKNLSEDYDIYLTRDKMCAGYIEKDISVCKGASGGGLMFKHDDRYYIKGIVSLSQTSPTSVDGCNNSNQYGLYTKVANYIYFILQKLAEFPV